MEDIDIEDLDFESYNREVYQERNSKSKRDSKETKHSDALTKFKLAINVFVEEYNKKNKIYEENDSKEDTLNKNCRYN